MSRVVWDYSSNSGILFLKNIECGGNDTSKAKYWCLVFINATETDSKQVP
jgi:hypothetical protein